MNREKINQDPTKIHTQIHSFTHSKLTLSYGVCVFIYIQIVKLFFPPIGLLDRIETQLSADWILCYRVCRTKKGEYYL